MPRRAATALVVGAVLVPVVVSLVAIVGREWRPSGDVALELLQVDAVGGGRTPLTGAWSRWGWDHPGPLLFWLLAPFSWIVGTHGALIGTLAINAAALVGAVLVARRHGGRSLATLIALGALLLCLARGPESLLDPWNPQVPVLVFLLFLLLAWALSVGDVVLAPFLVAAGTLCVQAHVSYLVLTVGVAVVATVLAWSARRPGAT